MERRKIGNYEIWQACSVGDVEVLLAENKTSQDARYAVLTSHQPPTALLPNIQCIAQSNSYLKMMDTFSVTVRNQTHDLMLANQRLGVPDEPLDTSTLLPNSREMDYTDRLVAVKIDDIAPAYRNQATQVVLAEYGFGCDPKAIGQKITGIEIATGDRVEWRRANIAGVLNPARLPQWVQQKIATPEYIYDSTAGTWQHLQHIKLYCPLTADVVGRDEDGDFEEYEYYGSLAQYEDQIRAAIENEQLPEEAERGLMTYYHEKDSVNEKVWAYATTVEAIRGNLYGVVDCYTKAPMNADEMEKLKDAISGQLSDGWGEGFEQRPIDIEEGELYVHFWSFSNDWKLYEEQEFQQMLRMKGGISLT